MNLTLSPEIEKRVKNGLAAGQHRDMNQSSKPRFGISSISANTVRTAASASPNRPGR
jgi:hypothetical protein